LCCRLDGIVGLRVRLTSVPGLKASFLIRKGKAQTARDWASNSLWCFRVAFPVLSQPGTPFVANPDMMSATLFVALCAGVATFTVRAPTARRPDPPNPVFSAWCTPSQGPTLIDACVVAQAAQPTIESADDGSMTISTNGTLPGQTKATCLVLAPHSSQNSRQCFPPHGAGFGFSIALRQGAHALSSRVRVRGCMVGYARVCAGVRHGRAPPRACVCVCVCVISEREP